MKYQIDQSGKIEQTNLDTIIALSNSTQYAIVLPKKTKRILQEIFRSEGRPRMFIYDTFSALIIILLLRTKPKIKVVIDKEYSNEDLIKARILEFKKADKIKYVPEFVFGLVGKSSPAHILAAKVANKKIKADLIISLEGISGVIWPSKKTGYSSIDRTEGNLTQDFIPGGRKPSQPFSKKRLSLIKKKVKKQKR